MESGKTAIEGAERVALEELRTLQGIVTHHQELASRLKGWYATVIGAIAYGVFLGHVPLAWWQFLGVGVTITCGFVYWLIFHRDVVALAIQRADTIEKQLRLTHGKLGYDGPRVAASLSPSVRPNHTINQTKSYRYRRLLRTDEQVRVPFGIAAITLLLLTFFVYHAAPATPDSGPKPPVVSVPAPAPPPMQPPSAVPPAAGAAGAGFATVQSAIVSLILAGGAVALALVIGGVFLLTRRNWFVKGVGTASILAGATCSIISIKEIKIEDIFKFGGPFVELSRPAASNVYIDQINLQNNVDDSLIKFLNSAPTGASRFSAEHIGELTGFPLGSATVSEAKGTIDALDQTCVRATAASSGHLYLVIGATDRLPLKPKLRLQYDANVGLAMARARAVKDYLLDHCWPKSSPGENILLPLAAGPQHTAPIEGNTDSIASTGEPTDRRVDVYMLSIVPIAAPGGQSAPGEHAGSPATPVKLTPK